MIVLESKKLKCMKHFRTYKSLAKSLVKLINDNENTKYVIIDEGEVK